METKLCCFHLKTCWWRFLFFCHKFLCSVKSLDYLHFSCLASGHFTFFYTSIFQPWCTTVKDKKCSSKRMEFCGDQIEPNKAISWSKMNESLFAVYKLPACCPHIQLQFDWFKSPDYFPNAHTHTHTNRQDADFWCQQVQTSEPGFYRSSCFPETWPARAGVSLWEKPRRRSPLALLHTHLLRDDGQRRTHWSPRGDVFRASYGGRDDRPPPWGKRYTGFTRSRCHSISASLSLGVKTRRPPSHHTHTHTSPSAFKLL